MGQYFRAQPRKHLRNYVFQEIRPLLAECVMERQAESFLITSNNIALK